MSEKDWNSLTDLVEKSSLETEFPFTSEPMKGDSKYLFEIHTKNKYSFLCFDTPKDDKQKVCDFIIAKCGVSTDTLNAIK